jgi:hypothetical protein
MCQAVKCSKCQKPSWVGCGAHVEQVLGHIPKSERCTCRESAATSGPPAKTDSLRRLFGGK